MITNQEKLRILQISLGLIPVDRCQQKMSHGPPFTNVV